jgi:hypothetical protein
MTFLSFGRFTLSSQPPLSHLSFFSHSYLLSLSFLFLSPKLRFILCKGHGAAAEVAQPRGGAVTGAACTRCLLRRRQLARLTLMMARWWCHWAWRGGKGGMARWRRSAARNFGPDDDEDDHERRTATTTTSGAHRRPPSPPR